MLTTTVRAQASPSYRPRREELWREFGLQRRAASAEEVLELTAKFMTDPVHMLIKREMTTLDGIKQFYVDCTREEYKYDVLVDLYETLSIGSAMIFVSSRRKVTEMHDAIRTPYVFT